MNAKNVLKNYYNYDSFREGQEEIIEAVMSGNDILAILPTGGGKSICYQIPALMHEGTAIVVSPLISLMKDQVDALIKRGISATFINSNLSNCEKEKRLVKMKKNRYKLVYVSPERLMLNSFIEICRQIKISFLAIDEAHCISMWGHDFRPSYVEIAEFVNKVEQKFVVAAYTATATKQVRDDICKCLKLNKPKIFIKSFARKNLRFQVIKTRKNNDKDYELIKLLMKHKNECGIVYAITRETTEQVSKLINKYGLRSNFYHGGVEKNKRERVQDEFINNKLDVVVATNAFGMGVDKSNVRYVIHYESSANIENYYQEAGRAGRDGELSYCYLLSDEKSVVINYQMIINQDISDRRKKLNIDKLKQMYNYMNNRRQCRSEFILSYFGEESQDKCGLCDVCSKEKMGKNRQKENYDKLEIRTNIRSKVCREMMNEQMMRWVKLLQPETDEEWMKIPGVGRGFVLSLRDEGKIEGWVKSNNVSFKRDMG